MTENVGPVRKSANVHGPNAAESTLHDVMSSHTTTTKRFCNYHHLFSDPLFHVHYVPGQNEHLTPPIDQIRKQRRQRELCCHLPEEMGFRNAQHFTCKKMDILRNITML